MTTYANGPHEQAAHVVAWWLADYFDLTTPTTDLWERAEALLAALYAEGLTVIEETP